MAPSTPLPVPDATHAALADAIGAAYPSGVEAVIAVVEAALTALEQRLTTRVAALETEVATLRTRLAADSRTSSKPPSTDISRAVRPVSLREPSGRRPGGQCGHPGETLAWHAAPDDVRAHRPAACSTCGRILAPEAPATLIERAQVVDLPPITLRTTEHRRLAVACAHCGQTSSGAFPSGLGVGVQYGPEIKALAVALHSYHVLPYARTAELLASLVGPGPSAGSLTRWTRAAAATLAPADRAAAAAITASPAAHADETGLHVQRATQWLHVASTATHTHYHIDRRRGLAGIEAGGVWSEFRGTMIHDALASYFQYEGATHQLCIAHLRREARGLVALTRALSPRGRPERWVVDIDGLLGRLHHLVTRAAAAGRSALDPRTVRRLTTAYDRIVHRALRRHPYPVSPVAGRDHRRRGRPHRGPVAAFADRLRKYRGEVLRCASDARIAPDNNQAERDLRMAKLADKISGGFRTPDGARDFAVLRGTLSTARKHGRTAIALLRDVFTPQPVHTPAPSG